MFAIIFVVLTVVLTIFYYRYNQCSRLDELFGCFVVSIGTQIVLLGLAGIVITLYQLKPL